MNCKRDSTAYTNRAREILDDEESDGHSETETCYWPISQVKKEKKKKNISSYLCLHMFQIPIHFY
jgi:hypothetical protein